MGAIKKDGEHIEKQYAVFFSSISDRSLEARQFRARLQKDGFETFESAEEYLIQRALTGAHGWAWFILPVYVKKNY